MKWIEPENGGKGICLNTDRCITMGCYDGSVNRDPFWKIAFSVNPSSELIYWTYPDESSRDADYERIRKIAKGDDGPHGPKFEIPEKKITVNGETFNFQSDGAEWNLDPVKSPISPLEQKRQKFHQMVLVQIGKRIKVHFHPGTEVPYYEFENDDLRRAFEEICRIPMFQEKKEPTEKICGTCEHHIGNICKIDRGGCGDMHPCNTGKWEERK